MTDLSGRRILIAEDEALVRLLLEDILVGFGALTVEACSCMADCKLIIATCEFDAAVLDINLRGDMSYPLAEILARKGIPVVLVTGYARDEVPAVLRSVPVIQKPYTAQEVGRAIASVMAVETPPAELT
jgi:CheY-like chemotaxis protein